MTVYVGKFPNLRSANGFVNHLWDLIGVVNCWVIFALPFQGIQVEHFDNSPADTATSRLKCSSNDHHQIISNFMTPMSPPPMSGILIIVDLYPLECGKRKNIDIRRWRTDISRRRAAEILPAAVSVDLE